MGDNDYLEPIDARKSVCTEEQTSGVECYHSTGGTTNPYCDYIGQQTVDENFSQLSLGSRQLLEGQIEEPTKNKGPKKFNDMLRHRLGKNRRKKAQTDESKKSIAGVNTGFFQKIFGRPSYFDEKDQKISDGLDSKSTSKVQMHSYQKLRFANEDEEGEDSDEVMWSDNEFDEDNVYDTIDDSYEAEEEERNIMGGEETRETQLTQFPDQSTQISNQLTRAATDESPPANEAVSTSSVKFNVLLRNFNRTKNDNGAGIAFSKVTQAEFGRKDIKSALRANGKPAECSQTNKWVKQKPTTDPQSSCCLDSETTHIKLIPANPGNACASKEGSVSITKPSDTNLTKPVSTSVANRGGIWLKGPGVAYVPKPSAANLTKPVATSVTKPVVVRAKNPDVAWVPKPSVACATTQPKVTWATAKSSFTSVMTKASVTRSIKNGDVDCTKKPVAVSAKERAVMFPFSDVREVFSQGKSSKEPKRTATPASDADHVSEQLVLDMNQTKIPNIPKMIELFESSKIPEKSWNKARYNKKTPGLLDNDGRSHAANNASMPGSHRCKPRVTISKKLNPMSDQRSFFSANQTSAAPLPLPARKCPGSSSEPAGRALPAKDGRAQGRGVGYSRGHILQPSTAGYRK